MNKIILNYIIINFLKTFLISVLIFYSFGLILNLFEEIEFFKDLEVSFITPLIVTSIFVPSIIVQLLPFIIFISSMWFMLKIRNNKDLLTLKVYGYSNIKIFCILAFTSFVLGWLILIIFNPISSSLTKFYEKTKSNYSKDVEHLASFNNNGIWIKEPYENGQRIITAEELEDANLINVTIFHLNDNFQIIEKIKSDIVNISNKEWIINDANFLKEKNNIFEKNKLSNLRISSKYDYEKITSLFKNFETISFLDLTLNYDELIRFGYNDIVLKQILNIHLSLPFFLLMMTGLASIFSMNTLKNSSNLSYIILGLIVSVLTFYFKDLSLALGKTDRIPIILSIWAPVLVLSFFTLIGIIQINEK
tara:strand:- start:3947 stop:5035 length:1089 start_codon:yes stop_codon:yes gene_type:complete